MIKNLVFLFLIVFQSISFAGEVSFKVQVEKDTYLLKEPIFIRWSVVNNGKEVLRYEDVGPTYGNMKYILVNDRGSSIPWNGVHTDYLREALWHGAIPVGDSLVNDFYMQDKNLLNGTRNLIEGKYSFTVIIDENTFIHQPQIISNTVHFAVIKPKDTKSSGYDDYATIMSKKYTRATDEVNDWEIFVVTYPHSVYTPNAIRQIISIYRTILNDKISVHKWDQTLFKGYPDNLITAEYLTYMLYYYESTIDSKERKRLMSLLNKMIEESPKSKSGILAKAALDRKKRTGKFCGFGAWPWVPVPLNERVNGFKYIEK
ncbi:MAG: hypothetical protein A2509_03665 [Candidatus Edwardsbacteria bacterium RIFOXYD12_FULL_50_11]|uniref:Uncharacterized protein n=1 Tax=Candidatus Edwardsbacteria bacterium GWF2_54_11 TaxID=1817851 RepID=A0A1F5R7Q9_9BACT|nr:MAG: hypothetical protein A2502_03580 [Candidatus Edwardsbacteria bacterium RifOxyC12_full_54_24]OGF07794.1 MAG: hypothetical protein A2273_04830 [Candidatus Edwardsbacteria bacterium RifOxyA12_full_54_48]OGF10042.1 MAG: hypothetical protein A3K15_11240 [Candidatus Edwardsbacteria bacterium GWE2_54_12]OGF10490.1 MAG: hypothetical protein A2024_09070 [Candidatus Edwardsbacteria bacterium GWF2_54_11]OGF14954.1 MAG: hypothetical protein A2509_03665 [Candidatus Edwardsbacteria bacterium RIFOXYD1